jgi:hypothetical protein
VLAISSLIGSATAQVRPASIHRMGGDRGWRPATWTRPGVARRQGLLRARPLVLRRTDMPARCGGGEHSFGKPWCSVDHFDSRVGISGQMRRTGLFLASPCGSPVGSAVRIGALVHPVH